jgi:hypothetical protein
VQVLLLTPFVPDSLLLVMLPCANNGCGHSCQQRSSAAVAPAAAAAADLSLGAVLVVPLQLHHVDNLQIRIEGLHPQDDAEGILSLTAAAAAAVLNR